MSFRLTDRQVEVNDWLAGPERHKLIYGGARSGKTFLIVRTILLRCIGAPKSRHLIARFRQNAIRASIALDTLPAVMERCFPQVGIEENRQDSFFELENGSQIWLAGLDEKQRVDKILGQEYATIFFNECSQIPRMSVMVARTRLAQQCAVLPEIAAARARLGHKNPGILDQRAYYDLNPVGSLHWSNMEFIRKVDPDTKQPIKWPHDFVYETMNPEHNKANLSADTIRELEALPERQRKRFYEGVFVNDIEGALWPIEVVEASCIEELPKRLNLYRTVVAIDPSGTRGDPEKRSDHVGIIVAAKGADGRAYVCHLRHGPGWPSPPITSLRPTRSSPRSTSAGRWSSP